LEIFNGSRNGEEADISGSFGDGFEGLLVLVEEQVLVVLNGVLDVQDLCEVERYPDMNVGRGGGIPSNILKEKFRFHKVEALHVNDSGSGSGSDWPWLILRRS
jgi:hypothetical protein